MKNILVPTDFSACAAFATEAAFELAAIHQATIHLYNKVDIPEKWINWSNEEKEANPEALHKVKNAIILLDSWKQKAIEKGISINTFYSGGNLLKNIQHYVAEKDIDFIVMGSHGAGGKNDYLIGSNTQKVVRLVHCPVLVIKNKPSESPIRKVVFASEFNQEEKKAFHYLLDLVRPLQPEIHLVQINTSSWFGQPYVLVKSVMEDFKQMCGDLKCFTHFYKDWSVDAGVRHFSEEIDADLIVLSNQLRHPIKRLFRGSNVEALVNHADLPVLSIDFPS